MSLKKPRIHLTGISNIDYKPKQEIKKIFNNFKNYTNIQEKDNFPDETGNYKAPKPKNPNLFNISLNDAIPQSGDSLMYAQTYKIRNEIKQKKLENDKEKKLRDINALSKVYNNSQKIDLKKDDIKKYVKTDVNEGKKQYETDEERLKYLRKTIKEKLEPHADIKKIFLLWQKNYLKNQELSVFDLHHEINKLGIPINYNETLGLISFANKRNTNTLNYDEFKNLFFDDSYKVNRLKKLSLIKIPENININKIEEENRKENENKDMKLANYKVFQNDHYITLETMLHIKNSNFLNSMNEINNKENNKNGNCDFTTFKKVLDTLKIPEKFKNYSIAKSIYNEFKLPDQDLMNYMNFIEKCKNLREPNNFFEFQNKYLDLLSKKLIDNEEKRKKYKDILLEDDIRKKKYVKSLNACKSMDKIYNINNKCLTEVNELNNSNNSINNEISNNYSKDSNDYNTIKTQSYNERYKNIKNDRYNNPINNNYNSCTISYDNSDTFNHYQPTFNFINLMYKDSRNYLDRYKEGVKEFSPIPIIRGKNDNIKSKEDSHFGGYFYKIRKTGFSSDFGSPGYIDNKERFNRNDIYLNNKKNKFENLEKLNKIKNEVKDKWHDIIDFQQKLTDVKESLGQIKRTKNLYEYENRVFERNKLQ